VVKSVSLPLNLSHVKRLIVNADDFGFNREITDGIIEAHQKGVVTSTTLMANMPAAAYAVEQSQACPDLSVGLHVNLTLGKPLSEPQHIPSLVRSDGQFLDRPTFFRRANRGQLNSSELRREISAQLQQVIDLGLTPTHADSHHHSTSCIQPYFAKLAVLKEANITRMRTHSGWYRRDPKSKSPLANAWATLVKNSVHAYRIYYELQHLYGRWKGMSMPDERLIFSKIVSKVGLDFDARSTSSYLACVRDGVTELSCHPGRHSDDPMDNDKMRQSRTKELAYLTDPSLRESIQARNIELISFREL